MPTDEQVEALARWMHELYLKFPGCRSVPWEELRPSERPRYLFVARELLENPPPPLTVKE